MIVFLPSPQFSNVFLHFIALYVTTCYIPLIFGWIQYPPNGNATMTHYTLPQDYIAACGCTAASTHYPTVAMSQMAFGSSRAYGPGCGRCFKLTLLDTYAPNPPFFPNVVKSVVVKVTDLCPAGGNGWCSATSETPNPGGQFINFDLAWPSPAIPDDFFPSNAAFYGYTDFGVWNVSYESVSCLQEWAGAKQRAALGSIDDGSSVCCPANPTGNTNDTCPSYSDQNGIPPDTTTSGALLLLQPRAASSFAILSASVALFLQSTVG